MAQNAKQALADAMNQVLANDAGQCLRERVSQEVPVALSSDGLRLLIHHEFAGDAAGVGFANATLMAAELGEGARRLYTTGLWYPGAALVRQLIECGYLLAVMGENRDEAASWIRSRHDEIVRRFMPRHLRERAVRNFRPKEYEKHCDLGGHPNPAGRVLLRANADHQLLSPRCHWLDLAEHLSDTWTSFVAALALYSPGRSPEQAEAIDALLAEWRRADRAALTASIPELAGRSS